MRGSVLKELKNQQFCSIYLKGVSCCFRRGELLNGGRLRRFDLLTGL